MMACINQMLVNLIGEYQEIVALGEFSDRRNLCAREDFASLIVRRIQDQGSSARGDCSSEPFDIQVPIRSDQRNEDGCCVSQNCVRAIVLVERFQDYYF